MRSWTRLACIAALTMCLVSVAVAEEDGAANAAKRYLLGFGPRGKRPGKTAKVKSLEERLARQVYPSRSDHTMSSRTQKLPEHVYQYYGGSAGTSGSRFGGSGNLVKAGQRDWSAAARLRFEVFAVDSSATLRVALEDEEVEPPVVRHLSIPADLWRTAELDLNMAVQQRTLDLTKMTSLVMTAMGHDGSQQDTILVKGLRLTGKNTPTPYPVCVDSRPHDISAFKRSYPVVTVKHEPRSNPGPRLSAWPVGRKEPHSVPLTKQVLPVFHSGMKIIGVSPCGWIAAAAPQHLLIGFTASHNSSTEPNVYCLQSLDGGVSWSGLGDLAEDGAPTPKPQRFATPLYISNPDHGATRGDVLAGSADVVMACNLGCSGSGGLSARVWTQYLKHTSQGWKPHDTFKRLSFFGSAARHCISHGTSVRDATGNIWMAFGLTGRLARHEIHAKYSTDEGRSWHTPKPGFAGTVHRHPTDKPYKFNGYWYEEPCIVAYGKSVACFWYLFAEGSGKGGNRFYPSPLGPLVWSRFEKGKWTAPEAISLAKKVECEKPEFKPTQPYAISIGEEIFVASRRYNGVLRYAGGRWHHEATHIASDGRLARLQDGSLVLVRLNESENRIEAFQRNPKGVWRGPVAISKEPEGSKIIIQERHGRKGFVLQPYPGGAALPVAWMSVTESASPEDRVLSGKRLATRRFHLRYRLVTQEMFEAE